MTKPNISTLRRRLKKAEVEDKFVASATKIPVDRFAGLHPYFVPKEINGYICIHCCLHPGEGKGTCGDECDLPHGFVWKKDQITKTMSFDEVVKELEILKKRVSDLENPEYNPNQIPM